MELRAPDDAEVPHDVHRDVGGAVEAAAPRDVRVEDAVDRRDRRVDRPIQLELPDGRVARRED